MIKLFELSRSAWDQICMNCCCEVNSEFGSSLYLPTVNNAMS
jgi:hypothetical protein